MKKTLKKIILSIFIVLTFSKQQAHAECRCVCVNHQSTMICESSRDRQVYCTNICY